MGKTRKVRVLSKKVNPLGIPSVRDIENEETLDYDGHPEGPIQAVMEQLQSPSTEEKLNGLQSLAILSINKSKVAEICTSDIIRIAAPLIMDPSLAVRNAASGALRNLSVTGVDVCEYMVEQDVLTPLLVLLTEYATDNTWVPVFNASMNNQLDERSDTFLQSINLLWNLCESTSVALDNFNQSQILRSFIRCLDYKVFGIDIAIAVAQCLLIISEDNPAAWVILNNFIPEFICLLNIEGDHSHTFLRTLAAAIITNAPALAAAHSIQIFAAVSKTLDVNHREILGHITSKLPLLGKDGQEIEVYDGSMSVVKDESEEAATLRRRKDDLPSEVEVEVTHVGFLLEAQRVAAEIITNLSSPDEEDWKDEDNEDLSENESVHDYDVSNHSSTSNLVNTDKLPVKVLEAVKSLGLVEKLWQRAQPIPDNVHQILRESSIPLLRKSKSLRISSLICLQNLCNAMSTEDLGGPDAIYSVWLDIGQQVFQGPQDPSLLEPCTSLMRAAVEHLRTSPNLFKQMTENDLTLMLNGVRNCSVAEIRANWLRMLGIMGCLVPEPLVRIIMEFILEISSQEQDVWTLSEAMDALMDMFTDNDWHEIAHELNLPQKSKALEKVFKNKIRQQKRELKDRYPAVMTVRTNLSRFTKYIEDELKNFTPNSVR